MIEDDEAVQRIKERFSPKQRAQIEAFVESLSPAQLAAVRAPMTDEQEEMLEVLTEEWVKRSKEAKSDCADACPTCGGDGTIAASSTAPAGVMMLPDRAGLDELCTRVTEAILATERAEREGRPIIERVAAQLTVAGIEAAICETIVEMLIAGNQIGQPQLAIEARIAAMGVATAVQGVRDLLEITSRAVSERRSP